MKEKFTLQLTVVVTYEVELARGGSRALWTAKENLEDMVRREAGNGAFTADMDDAEVDGWSCKTEVLDVAL